MNVVKIGSSTKYTLWRLIKIVPATSILDSTTLVDPLTIN